MKKRLFKGLLTGVALSASIVTLVSCGGSKEAKEYLVSFNSNDPDTSDSIRPTVYNDISVTSGDTIDLSQYQPTYEGYAFDGWYLDDTFETEFTSTTVVKSNLSLVAKWQDTVTVTFNTNGGSTVDPQTVNKNGIITKPSNPTKADKSNDDHTKVTYTFDGWYTDADFTTEFDFTSPVATDLVLYAKYKDELEAEPGYTLTTSSVLLADYETKTAAELTPFTTDDNVFAFAADKEENAKTLIADKEANWAKDEYSIAYMATTRATGVTKVELNKFDTIDGKSSATFTRYYALGGGATKGITVTCAKSGYIALYASMNKTTEGFVIAASDSSETRIQSPVKDKIVQYVFYVNAGTYNIYRTSGNGYVYYAEYFSVTENA